VETTARGAAMLAGVGVGLFPDLAAAGVMASERQMFTADMNEKERGKRLAGWQALLDD
jgi:glycerol kinase